MDIRTKLVFALVAVALGSMLALGAVMYASSKSVLKDRRLEQLEGIAESMKDGLEEVSSGWHDRVSLIASRTQLRQSLAEYNRTNDPQAPARIQRILADALSAVDIVQALSVYDAKGELVATVGPELATEFQQPASLLLSQSPSVTYLGATVDARDSLRVEYAATLALDNQDQGLLQARLSATSLLDLTDNRSRLGSTGEVMIVFRDPSGTIRVLHRTGSDGTRVWSAVEPTGPNDPVYLALQGEEVVRSEGVTDYRGKHVWTAIRYLPETGWGLIVKVDTEEAMAPVRAFQDQLIRLALSLGAFAILIGAILGIRFAAPIHDLAEVAGRIRGGALSARAEVTSEDEVGVLARTFNQMADELEQRVSLLREFQKYFELSLDMLCIAGTDGYFKRVNPAFERTLGWDTTTLVSKSFLEFVHPDDRPATTRELDKLARGIPSISFENRYRCADGSYKTLMWRAHPEPETGLVYAIARDITAPKERQERARREIETLRGRLEAAETKLRKQS